VEDQQPDSGDLTTGTETQAADANAGRRRHRMPLRKELAADSTDGADTTETTEQDEVVAGTAEAEPAPPRRRWNPFRRRPKSVEPEPVSDTADEVSEGSAGPRVPVGKRRRAAKAEPEPTADEADQTEETVAEAGEDGEPEPEGAPGPEQEQVLVPFRPAGKRLTVAAAAAGAVLIGAAAFAGATLQPYLADRALVHTKLDIARTAANAITTLWTYNPDNMESLPDRAAGYLGGDFANEYRKYIDAIVASNKQAQVTNTTQVMGTAVETVTPSEATAIVYTNSVATSPVSKNIPSLRYLSYRLTLQRHDANWLITRMSTVTSFDLTPQL
jgi:Mce-associated membrane protein